MRFFGGFDNILQLKTFLQKILRHMMSLLLCLNLFKVKAVSTLFLLNS